MLPCRWRSQDALELLGGENLQDAADERRFTNSGAARNDHHLVLASLTDCLLLPRRQLDAQLPFDPGDGLLHVDAGQGMRRGRGDPMNGLGKSHLGTIQPGQVKPRLAINGSRMTVLASTPKCTASSTIFWSISTSFVVCSTTPGSG